MLMPRSEGPPRAGRLLLPGSGTRLGFSPRAPWGEEVHFVFLHGESHPHDPGHLVCKSLPWAQPMPPPVQCKDSDNFISSCNACRLAAETLWLCRDRGACVGLRGCTRPTTYIGSSLTATISSCNHTSLCSTPTCQQAGFHTSIFSSYFLESN